MKEYKNEIIKKQLEESKLLDRYEIIKEEGMDVVEALSYFNQNVTTMGRGLKEDLDYFVTLGAVGRSVVKHLNEREEY